MPKEQPFNPNLAEPNQNDIKKTFNFLSETFVNSLAEKGINTVDDLLNMNYPALDRIINIAEKRIENFIKKLSELGYLNDQVAELYLSYLDKESNLKSSLTPEDKELGKWITSFTFRELDTKSEQILQAHEKYLELTKQRKQILKDVKE